MKDILDEFLPAELTEEQILNWIIQEVRSKSDLWADKPDKLEFSLEISELLYDLDSAISLTNNPAKAAYITFKLAALISQVSGSRELRKIVQRHDAMSIEIDGIITELKNSGEKPKAVLIWNELVKHCGQKGSCCICVEHDSVSDEQIIVWGRPGGAVDRMKYSSLQRRVVRKKRR